MNKLIIAVIACSVFVSCSSSSQKSKEEKSVIQSGNFATQTHQFENIEQGKIVAAIKCKADTSNSYALYIPSSYNSKSPSPVIFFFDPHAAGALPLKKYQALANKYGYIFAGSNNSKNGNTSEVNGTFAANMMNDLQSRLNIDRVRIYTSGFSGGSRVASAVAIFHGGVNTVIGCSAGFPNIDKPIENKFNYVGIAGEEDFNYDEMQEIENMLKTSDVEHVFLPFNGKHEWCPVETMDNAFTWLQFKAMKENLIPKNDSLVNSFLSAEQHHIDELIKMKKEDEALTVTRQAESFISGLSDDKKLTDIAATLEKSDGVKKVQARKAELASTEKALKEQYTNAMAIKDVAWWKTETQLLNNTKRFPADQVMMNKRVLSYLSLACYMNINQMLHNNQATDAEHFISIYKIIDPTNPEAPYLQATIYKSKADDNGIITELNNAVKLGFKEYDRFVKDFGKYPFQISPGDIGKQIKDNSTKEQE